MKKLLVILAVLALLLGVTAIAEEAPVCTK